MKMKMVMMASALILGIAPVHAQLQESHHSYNATQTLMIWDLAEKLCGFKYTQEQLDKVWEDAKVENGVESDEMMKGALAEPITKMAQLALAEEMMSNTISRIKICKGIHPDNIL